METTTCATIVLVLLWLSLCCQLLGFLVNLLEVYSSIAIPTTTTLSAVLLGICLWQCNKAGYLISPMTWYHWVLLVLLVLLQVVAILMAMMEQLGWGSSRVGYGARWKYPIYGVAVVLVAILGGTLFCGWKCNLFCRPCCKSQYVCYVSAVVLVLAALIVLAVTVSMIRYESASGVHVRYEEANNGQTELAIIRRVSNMVIPISQCYALAMIWKTMLELPYTVAEVVALIAAALAVASILALAVPRSTMEYYPALPSTTAYPLLAVHILALGITWYYLEYKAKFCCYKQYLCLGVLLIVLLVAMVVVAIEYPKGDGYGEQYGDVKYTMLVYSLLLMIPTLWYAYRCGLFKWCLPKKRSLNGTDTAENTTADSDIAKES